MNRAVVVVVVALVVTAVALALALRRPNAETAVASMDGLPIPTPPDPTPAAPPGMLIVEAGVFQMGTADVEPLFSACVEAGIGSPKDCRWILSREAKSAGERTVATFALDEREVESGSFAQWLLERHAEVDKRGGSTFLVDPTDGAPLLMLFKGGSLRREGDSVIAVPRLERTPARAVTRTGAERYCRELGRRLPTEVEWEYAARGSSSTTHVAGDAPPACNVAVYGRGKPRACPGDAVPKPVDRPVADVAWSGARDLAGNVSEWVTGEAQPGAPGGIYKGGSFADPALLARPALRSFGAPDEPFANVGFRCAADLGG